jgi:hypothetical protein
MKKPIWSGICAAGLFSATVVMTAQQPAPTPSPSQQSPVTQPSSTSPPTTAPPTPTENANSITVTGCLQLAPPAPTGTAGVAGAASDAAEGEKFVLADAKPTAPKEGAPTASASTARTYRLIANEAALAPHAGKKVEITGTVDDQPAANAGSSASPGAGASSAATPKLNAVSAKILAPNCAG